MILEAVEKATNTRTVLGLVKETEVGYYRVEMPEGAANGHTISFNVSALSAKDYVPTAVAWSELIA